MAVLLGTLGEDTVQGTSFIDVITALGGNDTIIGRGGADVIDAGSGNDTVYANSTRRWNDAAIDTVLGGAGNDHVYGGYGDILNGGTGFDRLSLDLSAADHGIRIDFRPMTLASVADRLTIRIDGTELSGFQAVADVRGSAFDDRITVGNQGSVGTSVNGAAGNDRVLATRGADHLRGGDGNDVLMAGVGRDTLLGGDGDDRLIGGRSQDVLRGGTGADRFVFDDGDTAHGRLHADTILDFRHADADRISLRGVDAVAGGDDDRFTFIGEARFSGTAGELRVVVGGGSTFLIGDTDGDAHGDVTIRLDGQVDLVRADLIL